MRAAIILLLAIVAGCTSTGSQTISDSGTTLPCRTADYVRTHPGDCSPH